MTQKIDPNSRMPRIFMDSVDKSAFYIYVISRNKMAQLGKGYSTYVLLILFLISYVYIKCRADLLRILRN